jgi:hypothetical protein
MFLIHTYDAPTHALDNLGALLNWKRIVQHHWEPHRTQLAAAVLATPAHTAVIYWRISYVYVGRLLF